MRQVRAQDAWRRTKELNNYNLRIDKLNIDCLDRYSDGFSMKFDSGLNAICGRNGVGKSHILKKIYELSNGDFTLGTASFESYNKRNSIRTPLETPIDKVFYIEPSIECAKILNYLHNTSNIDELLEGIEPNSYFSSKKNLDILTQIVAKPYKSIELYEIDGAIDDNYTFPYIRVETRSGLKYSCSEMGMGELLSFYVVWFLRWVEKDSIILIEELENFLSAHSQVHLINHLADASSSKSLWTIITSHSEYILSNFDKSSLFLISQDNFGKTKIFDYSSEKQYKDALGITSRKNSSILFEDFFAREFAKLLLSTLNPTTLQLSNMLYVKGGESDLEKIATHFQPIGDLNHHLSCVFDADQSAKVVDSNKRKVPVLALPSQLSLNPEEELWSTVQDCYVRVAAHINISDEILLEACLNNASIDHHDRFSAVAQSINKDLSNLLDCIVKVWLEDKDNYNLAEEFKYAIIARGEKFRSFPDANKLYKARFGKVLNEVYEKDYKELRDFRVTFIGHKLVFHKI